MANGLAVWLVSYQLWHGGPWVVDEMVFDRDAGCTEWCVSYMQSAHAWAIRAKMPPPHACGCTIRRECTRLGCVNEKLQSNIRGEIDP